MSRWLLAPLAAVALASAASADPVRYLPKNVTLVATVENPRKLVEAVTKLELYGQYEALPAVKQLLGSTQAKRAFQMLAHVEKKLGAKWPELLDSLAGNGLALGATPGTDNAPVVLAMQGTNDAAVAEGFDLFVQLAEEELTRQSGGTAVKLPRGTHDGATTLKFGDFNAARIGNVVLLSNSEAQLNAAIARTKQKADTDSALTVKVFADAKKALGGKPLASLWFNLLPVKETQATKDFFASSRKDFLQTMVVGSSIDAVRRSDFVAAGLFQAPTGFKLSVRLPAKRDGVPKEFGMHVPMSPDTPGTLPLLEPPGVLYSQSLHLDLAAMWKDRKALFNEQVLADIEKGVKDLSKVLPGATVEKLFALSGPHLRFVAVERGVNHYTAKPGTQLPEMAVVLSMRDPEFATGMATTLRTAGVLASLQFKMKLTEETVDGVKIASYRFSETNPYPGDDDNLRYNFVPSFATVRDSFVISTSPKLLVDLIAELKKPMKSSDVSPAVWRGKLYGTGAATAIRARPDASISDAVLSRGVGLKQAKAEVEQTAAFLDAFGTAGFQMDHGKDAFKFDIEWNRK